MSSLPNSRVFATCYICREKSTLQTKRKRTALQEIDSNISLPPVQQRATSISQVPLQPAIINHGPILPVQLSVSTVQLVQPTPVELPPLVQPLQITTVQPTPIGPPLPESLLPGEQW